MVLDFAEGEVDDKGEEGESQKSGGGNDSKPLIVAQVFTLQVRDPVELGHILIIYNLLSLNKGHPSEDGLAVGLGPRVDWQ